MAELKIIYAELETALQLSKDINKELASSYQTVGELRSYLESAAWSGQTKNAFMTYLNLIYQYHNDLIGIMKEHETAVTSLKQSIDDYNSSSEVASIRG